MENKKIYNEKFYDERQWVLDSAEVIVPKILQLFKSKSVVDVGCATGEFLKIFQQKGIKEILGIDGGWVNKERLCIPKKSFVPADLNNPPKINKKFDLVVSLETAEHLPKINAEKFVSFLTSLGEVIFFSAAIPGQGGINHLNEQFQDYWANLFRKKNYVAIDCLRKEIWDDEKVSIYYRQNSLIYVKKSFLLKNKILKNKFEETSQSFISVIHPELYYPVIMKQKKLGKFLPKPLKSLIGKFLKI